MSMPRNSNRGVLQANVGFMVGGASSNSFAKIEVLDGNYFKKKVVKSFWGTLKAAREGATIAPTVVFAVLRYVNPKYIHSWRSEPGKPLRQHGPALAPRPGSSTPTP